MSLEPRRQPPSPREQYRLAARILGRVLGDAAMSGVRLPYLERRQGMWNLRIRVPDSVKLRLGY